MYFGESVCKDIKLLLTDLSKMVLGIIIFLIQRRNIQRLVDLAGLLFSGISAMLYALVGGILSAIVMIILKKSNKFTIFGISVGGASAHIIGQILLAVCVIQNSSILLMIHVLLISAVVSGIIIGFISRLLIHTLNKVPSDN